MMFDRTVWIAARDYSPPVRSMPIKHLRQAIELKDIHMVVLYAHTPCGAALDVEHGCAGTPHVSASRSYHGPRNGNSAARGFYLVELLSSLRIIAVVAYTTVEYTDILTQRI